MPLPRDLLDAAVARLNEARKPDERVQVEAYEPPGRFILSFPDRPMPEGQCIDQDFSEVQFLLHERHQLFTDLRGGRKDDDAGRYHIQYEVVEWD